ncbi:MAG TPA: hypothetical protein VKB88_39010 [Bryobacteraceae bacterium]|nr:hypothetical protein [Bryobacteraceae bacterium]
MKTRQDLETALAALAASDQLPPAPDVVPDALISEFVGQAGSLRAGWKPAPIALAAAACLLAALLLLAPQPAPPPARQPAFVPIPYVAPLAPYERPQVVRMDIPMMALMAAGLEVHTNDAGGHVTADVLIGQDGRALAIRLIPGPISDTNRRYQE